MADRRRDTRRAGDLRHSCRDPGHLAKFADDAGKQRCPRDGTEGTVRTHRASGTGNLLTGTRCQRGVLLRREVAGRFHPGMDRRRQLVRRVGHGSLVGRVQERPGCVAHRINHPRPELRARAGARSAIRRPGLVAATRERSYWAHNRSDGLGPGLPGGHLAEGGISSGPGPEIGQWRMLTPAWPIARGQCRTGVVHRLRTVAYRCARGPRTVARHRARPRGEPGGGIKLRPGPHVRETRRTPASPGGHRNGR